MGIGRFIIRAGRRLQMWRLKRPGDTSEGRKVLRTAGLETGATIAGAL